VVEEKWDGRREMEQIGEGALDEDGGRGVYSPVVRESVCKRMKLKEINGVPLEHDRKEGFASD
jgi:hypothetical protein